jgi:hypothetical protein
MSPPILIVAAGRSGTKLLRGILASSSEVKAFPREINYIWRYGNADFPTDELKPEHARPEVVHYIRERFAKFVERHDEVHVVEKTCANTLRLDFVHRVFPEAYIIHLVRDGRAVAESARRRWQARPELRYLLEKARWVPLSDVPYYALRYLRYQVGYLRSDHRAKSSWGPRFSGLDRLVEEKMLIEVCGLQWKACVQAAGTSMNHLPSHQSIIVRYEDLVSSPKSVAKTIFDQVGLPFTPASCDYVEHIVRQDNLNKWRKALSIEELELLMPHIESELEYYGYEI